MITRGSAIFQSTKDVVFDALLQSCKEIGADVKSVDRTAYRIDGKTGTMWLQNRFSFPFQARLADDDGQGVRLEIYDFFPFAPDKRFIDKLLKKNSNQDSRKQVSIQPRLCRSANRCACSLDANAYCTCACGYSQQGAVDGRRAHDPDF